MIAHLEFHVITACAVLLALEPARKLRQQMVNWLHRHRIHREHLKQLERENG